MPPIYQRPMRVALLPKTSHFGSGTRFPRSTALVAGIAKKSGLSRRQRRAVKQLVDRRSELKWFQPTLASQAVTATGTVVGMTDIAQGDTDQTREGDQLRLCGNIQFRGFIHTDITGDTTQHLPKIRLVIFQWHPQTESGGATEPTVANLLDNGPSGSPDIFSIPKHDNRFMYTILYDRLYRMVGPGVAAGGPMNPMQEKIISRNISLSRARKKIQYSAGSQTVACNHLYIMYISDLAADAQNPTITWSAKIVFRDN